MTTLTAYVMVGAPGAGKSTHAAALAEQENAVVVSGDDIREELYGDAAIQGQWDDVWDRIDQHISECCGMSVILDGTHCRADYRAEAIALLRSYGYDRVEAVVLDTPLGRCLTRNAERDRHVPEHVIRRMHDDYRRSLKTIYDEDFDHIRFIY